MTGGGSAPVASDAELAACRRRLDVWTAARATEGLPVLAAGREPDEPRWHVRLRGVDKEVVTVWLTVRQRTLHHEAQMMPAPAAGHEQVWAFLLRRNRTLPQLRFALGPEDAVLVVGEVPVARVDDDELDRIVGGSLALVDDCYPTAMALGYPGLWRPRPARRTPG